MADDTGDNNAPFIVRIERSRRLQRELPFIKAAIAPDVGILEAPKAFRTKYVRTLQNQDSLLYFLQRIEAAYFDAPKAFQVEQLRRLQADAELNEWAEPTAVTTVYLDAPIARRTQYKRKLLQVIPVAVDAAIIAPIVEPAVSGGADPSPFDFKHLFAKQVIEEDREIMIIIKEFLRKQ